MDISRNGETVVKIAPKHVLSMYLVIACIHIYVFEILKKISRPKFVGDAFCDDDNNYEDCNYDGGDCCGGKTNYCTKCECKNPSDSDSDSGNFKHT